MGRAAPSALLAVVTLAVSSTCNGFVTNCKPFVWRPTPTSSLSAEASEGGEDDEDWRDFRAKLVMSHRQKEGAGLAESIPADNSTTATRARDQSKTEESSLHWAYESGDAIEVGSIILACPEQDFGYGLRQQYFHKCLVLVTYHDERSLTKGIILNRPTDLVFGDEDLCNADGSPLKDTRPGRKWRTMYGGEVKGLDSDDPEQTVLHCLDSNAAKEVSTKVLTNLYWTTMAGARLLVTDGHAEPEDFIVYCGYAGWGAGQLSGELERGAWHMVTASGSLVKEVKRTIDAAHPERAGLDTWAMLMEKIGRKSEVSRSEGRFDDLMLLEWAKHNLVLQDKVFAKTVEEESVAIMERLSNLESIGPGTIIRSASPSDKDDEQPFLLDGQEFLESCILILQDDDTITVAAMLNIPSAHSVDIDIDDAENDEETKKQVISIPQRYGGRFGLKGQSTKPTVWLHNSESLKKAKVGSPLGDNESNFWCCSQNDVATALLANDGLAAAQDFICINGFTVWEKSKEEDVIDGLVAEILYGKFDVVPSEWSEEVYEELIVQNESILTPKNLDSQLELAQEIWKCAGGSTASNSSGKGTKASVDLAEMAKKSWWSTFLLGDPSLRFG